MGFTFNSLSKDYIHININEQRPAWAPVQRNLKKVKGFPGAYLESTDIKERVLPVPIQIKNTDFVSFEELKEDLASWLITEDPAELIFDDEPDRVYFAVVDGSLNLEEIIRFGRGTLTFICPDPYKYGPEQTATLSNTTGTVVNVEGTAETKPIFEFDITNRTTFLMVSNGNEYMMIGRPVKVDEATVDTRTLLLQEDGSTLNTWDTTPISTDGGTNVGSFGTDGTAITIESYGQAEYWHGPGLIKSLPALQDFEVEMICEAETTTPGQTFRVEFYLFDEGMNELGKMNMWDNNPNMHQREVEGRVGSKLDDFVNYPLNSRNYQFNDLDKWFGIMRMKREGDKFTFYTATIGRSNRHNDPITKRFNDVNKKYAGRLKYVQIHIGNYGDTGKTYLVKINSIKAYELNEATIDQTPYIAYPGDKVIFDHKTEELLINGEDRTDLKDFGGEYFKLKTGQNEIATLPNNAFNGILKYRERYK